jgi:N-acylneuraminate cytidylyltransferase
MANNFGIFLPTRLGSERVKDKNTKPFAGYKGGLLELKLLQLLEIKNATIYLSTDDPKSIEIGQRVDRFGRLKIIQRPKHLCLSSTPLKELIDYVPTIVKEEHIVWTHVTSPMVHSAIYSDAIDSYFKSIENDSLMSVKKLQNFLWSKESGFVNFSREFGHWPRTQDIQPLFEVNSAFFIASKKVYLEGDRIGRNPQTYELSPLQSTDVDWEEDFEIAEKLFTLEN